MRATRATTAITAASAVSIVAEADPNLLVFIFGDDIPTIAPPMRQSLPRRLRAGVEVQPSPV